tara:strand:- start:20515 stop:21471 length:957 start_codon:yes stop_codon:yes gene_type:complete
MSSDATVYVLELGDNLDQGAAGEGLRALLHIYGIRVEPYRDAGALLAAIRAGSDADACVLIALQTTDDDGVKLVRTLSADIPEFPIIVLGDDADAELRARFVAAGAIDLVNKCMVDAYIFTRLSKILPGDTKLPETATSTMQLSDGSTVTLRMITPEDAGIEQQFVTALSERSRYLRFFSGLRTLPPFMLRRLVSTQFPASYALIATVADGDSERQIGVARYAPTEDEGVAEFAVVVADEWQGRGIASQLLRYIIAAATVAGLDTLEGLVLRENRGMLRLARKLGFDELPESGEGQSLVKVVKKLRRTDQSDQRGQSR